MAANRKLQGKKRENKRDTERGSGGSHHGNLLRKMCHFVAPHATPSPSSTALHCTALHCTALHCTVSPPSRPVPARVRHQRRWGQLDRARRASGAIGQSKTINSGQSWIPLDNPEKRKARVVPEVGRAHGRDGGVRVEDGDCGA
jgi:hypothetical protein